jgi:hypothetical protein
MPKTNPPHCSLPLLKKNKKNNWQDEIDDKLSENYDPYQYVYETIDGDIYEQKSELIEHWDWGD